VACVAGYSVLHIVFDTIRSADSTGKPDAVVERALTHFHLYKVLLHNDDRNTTDHVIRSLMKVFHFGQAECEQIMLEAHHKGVALCTVEPLEQAEFHRDQLGSLSLTATIEPE
jgi:ATP-dependent Clp protease adaptor protein ClpS